MEQQKLLINAKNIDVPLLFGEFDNNIKVLCEKYNVNITYREDNIIIIGDNENIRIAHQVILKMIDEQKIRPITNSYVLDLVEEISLPSFNESEGFQDKFICTTTSGKAIRAKTKGQSDYIDTIKNNTITFGVGPAGTGKTYLAMAMAIKAFKNNEVQRIVLTRPVVEAGERLGFLPGDLQSKIDPYLRPLYDALYDIMGMDTFLKNMERGAIEIAPLAYMRGRTLDNSFIILDEAQNTTKEQMKMFLTRIGFGSKVIITGDTSQIDLPNAKNSGLKDAISILNDIDDIGIVRLTSSDVVRHKLVAKIIKAYDVRDAKLEEEASKRKEASKEV